MPVRPMLMFAALVTVVAVSGPALAEKPSGRVGPSLPTVGSGPGGAQIVISPRDQRTIRDYYAGRPGGGHCPPGLAKKNNGCLPPGQAKNWSRGQPLGQGVVFSPLPPELQALLNTPIGYQFVQILNDVLLISNGNRTVVDAVPDLR